MNVQTDHLQLRQAAATAGRTDHHLDKQAAIRVLVLGSVRPGTTGAESVCVCVCYRVQLHSRNRDLSSNRRKRCEEDLLDRTCHTEPQGPIRVLVLVPTRPKRERIVPGSWDGVWLAGKALRTAKPPSAREGLGVAYITVGPPGYIM